MNESTPGNTEPSAANFLSGLRGGGSDDTVEPTNSGGGLTELASAKPARRVSVTNIIIALVVVISASSLYLMRKQGKGAGMTFQVSKIDYELENAGKHDNSHLRILAELARTEMGAWVPTEKIQKNPFQLENDSPTAVPDTDLDRRRRAEQEQQELERRKQEIQRQLAGLEVNSIMGGTIPLARISGQTVRTGEIVSDFFEVKTIDADQRTVTVSSEGQTYTLRMGESGGAPKQPAMPRRR